ncbi:MAG: hypothetical protein OJF47_003903 [Nitrospira sp.]|nr:MAG: hypothetical protein OJF47_003903 [Nitrospira sp.]
MRRLVAATCGGSHGRVAAVALSEGDRSPKVHSTQSEWKRVMEPSSDAVMHV